MVNKKDLYKLLEFVKKLNLSEDNVELSIDDFITRFKWIIGRTELLKNKRLTDKVLSENLSEDTIYSTAARSIVELLDDFFNFRKYQKKKNGPNK